MLSEKKEKIIIGFLISSKTFKSKEEILKACNQAGLSLYDFYQQERKKIHEQAMIERNNYYRDHPKAQEELNFLAELQLRNLDK